MRLFYVESVNWAFTDFEGINPQEMIGLELGRRLQPKELYFSTDFEVQFLLKAAQRRKKTSEIKIISQNATTSLTQNSPPVALGNTILEENHFSFDSLLKEIFPANTIKLGVLSPFGRNLGDSLMFFTVVNEYQRRAVINKKKLEIHLFNAVLPESIGPTYRKSTCFYSISEFPCEFSLLHDLDAYIDFCRPHLHYDIPWVDSLFELSGILPDSVPLIAKRNTFTLNDTVYQEVCRFWKNFTGGIKRPVIIFNRESSTYIRTMPEKYYRKFINEFLELTDYHFVSLTPINFKHPRFTDLSSVSSSFDRYVSLVSLADGFITVDTSLYHFADAFNVPGVVIFTSQPPSRFSKYYPLVKGFQVEGGEKLDLKSWSNDPKDIKYANSLWKTIDAKTIIKHLNELLFEKL
jgi:hypothetical protein